MASGSDQVPEGVIRSDVKIELLKDEEELFNVLRQAVEELKLGTVMRVAGGWVRDKILHLGSNDIDIALDNMNGETFAQHVNAYLTKKGTNTRNIGVVKANPERSKHLETATMKVLDHSVDFVNLRCETYSEHSRIPEMTMGTAQEDALRRDLTINALFYNISFKNPDGTFGCVEDYTLHGVDDLEKRIARTPLEPLRTFLDDPLRVLRTVRFATRFQLRVEPSVSAAMKNEQVVDALQHKISRERIGAELLGCLRGPAPHQALIDICDNGLYDAIFSPLAKPDQELPPLSDIIQTGKDTLKALLGIGWPSIVFEMEKERRNVNILAAFLYPYNGYTCKDHKKRKIPVVKDVILQSIKLPLKLADSVHTIQSLVPTCIDLMSQANKILTANATNSEDEDADTHVTGIPEALGLQIAAFVCKARVWWEDTVYLACAVIEHGATAKEGRVLEGGFLERERFCRLVRFLHLDKAYEIKPLVNGKVLAQELGVKGPALGSAVKALLDWQFVHHEGTREEALIYLKGKFAGK